LPAWEGWQVTQGNQVGWASVLLEAPNQPGRFLPCVASNEEPLILSRQLRLQPQDHWLLLAVSQQRAQQGRPKLQVLLAGETVFEQEIPYADKWRYEIDPLVIPLDDFHGGVARDVAVEIRQLPGPQATPVHWQGVMFAQRLPMLRTVFEDEGSFAKDEAGAEAPAAKLVRTEKYSGEKAVELAAGTRYRFALDSAVAVRERPAWGEFRFLRFAFRKHGAGRVCWELDHRDAAQRPTRYDAGVGEPCYAMAKRVWDRRLSDEWTVITRDVYADFGDLDVVGLVVSAPDGDGVLVDHIHWARSINDFRYLEGR
jgi:hypothetical protein